MGPRPALLVSLAAALVALLLLPGTALAPTPSTGKFSGKTAQGRNVGFRVVSGGAKLQKLKVGYEADCPSGTAGGTVSFAGSFRIRDGRFSVSGGDTTVRGRFTSSRKARGSLRWRGRVYSPFGSEQCDSGRVSWSARRR